MTISLGTGFFAYGLGLFIGGLMDPMLNSFIAGGVFMLLALILISADKTGVKK